VRRSRRLVPFILILQSILFLAHFLLYQTWVYQGSAAGIVREHVPGLLWSKLALAILSVTFVPASLLAFRYSNAFVRGFYRIAAVWVGFLSFLFIAAVVSWAIYGVALVAGFRLNFHTLVDTLFAIGFAAGFYGLLNATLTRITRITVRLANLPASWRGRKAALISDVHLGHVRNRSFLRRMVAKILRERPHAVFIAGDLYDGTAIDATRAVQPLSALTAPHGVYFVAGNHEQFRDDKKYLDAVAAAGVRVLHNDKVDVDGLQIAGVPYRNAWHPSAFASALHALGLDRNRASILLTHAPDHPEIAEAAGIGLQLSGHTHLGQFIPWSWIAKRIYKQFVYGLSRIGNLQVFTSSGAGTWGPPLRLGSNPEIVVLQFE
jgi:predicted MPP superfamily phosphohydrolase